MSGGSFAVGTAHRTPVQPTPVIHILVPCGSRWDMWCTAGRGREDNPLGNRLCPSCQHLAREALANGMLAPSEVGVRWFTDKELAEHAGASA